MKKSIYVFFAVVILLTGVFVGYYLGEYEIDNGLSIKDCKNLVSEAYINTYKSLNVIVEKNEKIENFVEDHEFNFQQKATSKAMYNGTLFFADLEYFSNFKKVFDGEINQISHHFILDNKIYNLDNNSYYGEMPDSELATSLGVNFNTWMKSYIYKKEYNEWKDNFLVSQHNYIKTNELINITFVQFHNGLSSELQYKNSFNYIIIDKKVVFESILIEGYNSENLQTGYRLENYYYIFDVLNENDFEYEGLTLETE